MIFIDQNDILGPFDRLSYHCRFVHFAFVGSFLRDVQCSEHYSASDRKKLEMCAKFSALNIIVLQTIKSLKCVHNFISMRPLTWKTRRAAEGRGSHPPDLGPVHMNPGQ